MAQRVLQFILIVGAALFGVGVVLFFAQNTFAQTTYYGPTSPVPGLVKVEIHIYDDPSLGGVTIESASFNNQAIILHPAGIRGFRGGGSFQVSPGTYKLVWAISRGKNDWPRTVRHEEKIQIKATDTWVQISIQGEKATFL